MANMYTGGLYGSVFGPVGTAGGAAWGSGGGGEGMSWTGEGSGIPGFAEQGTWWDPAGLFAKPKPLSLPKYADPTRPGYSPVFDPNTMSLALGAAALTGNIMPDSRGMNEYRTEALRTGPSAWSRLARNQLAGDEAAQRDKIASSSAGAAADARSQIARRGGLSSGASERLATDAARNQTFANQGLAANILQGQREIATNDESNRVKMLTALPGMELEQIKPQQWSAEQVLNARRGDITNQIGENRSLNDFNMAAWIQQMQQIQSRRNADVTLATAPKDKGFFGNIMSGLF
jgi:hypothetical protein